VYVCGLARFKQVMTPTVGRWKS